ncbi:MAG: cupin [Spirochaetes bacterium RIFOXYC1_FULL_54_7]|nr:MAG: cupin [Spirochaetes bacterium RIFOXYC1_FULL_54_7]
MVRKASGMRSEARSEMGGGKGIVDVIHILEKNELKSHGRLFARNILKPGTSIGFHQHVGDFEIYYIAKGEGVFNDNGVLIPVCAGDVGIIDNLQSHAIENTGIVEMEVIAVVLYE